MKQGKPEVAWGGPKPLAWTHFSASRIHGVKKCGSVSDSGEEPSMCDICNHVRVLGTWARDLKVGPQSLMFVPRSEATIPATEVTKKRSWCEECSQPTGPGLSHPCTPVARKKNIIKLIEKQPQKEKDAIVGNSLQNMVKVGNKDRIGLYWGCGGQ